MPEFDYPTHPFSSSSSSSSPSSSSPSSSSSSSSSTSSSTLPSMSSPSPSPSSSSSGETPSSPGFQRYLVVVMVTLSLIFAAVEGRSIPEEKHPSHRFRHHGRDRKMSYHVRNREDALHYLQKYGYLEHCTIPSRQKRKTSSSSSPSSSSSSPSTTTTTTTTIPIVSHNTNAIKFCTPREQKEAIRALQETFHLPTTGKLDEKTKKLMEIRRCGNADTPELVYPAGKRRKRSVVGGILVPEATLPDQSNPGPFGEARLPGRDGNASNGRNLNAILEFEGRIPSDPFNGFAINEAQHNRSNAEIVQKMLDKIKKRLNETLGNSTDLEPENLEEILQERMNLSLGNRTRSRRKRSISDTPPQRILLPENNSSVIRWRLLRGESETLTFADQKAALLLAFRMWADCVPVKFQEVPYVDVRNTDSFIRFAKRNHMNCEKPFDGFGGELAHSWAFGDIHFDGDEHFKKLHQYNGGLDMLRVAIHEVGHVLGLHHTEERNSIMFPLYIHMDYDQDYEIPEVDRRAVQKVFGVCKGTFDAVFDWVHFVEEDRVYTSFFMREGRYWRYSNRNRRPISDDDVDIASRWPDLPPRGINSFLQINLTETAYIFSGENCYKMDSTGSYVMNGYPRKISEEFPPKSDLEPLPGEVDASFFHWTNLIYLLKGEWVWICSADKIGQSDCCFARLKFTEVFSTKPTQTLADEEVTGNVTSIFFSHAHQVYYLLRDTVYYEMRAAEGNSSDPALVKFNLYPRGYVWQKWLDLCDSSS